MAKTIYTHKLVLKDKYDPTTEIHITLENGALKTEKVTTVKEKVELNSITEL